MLRVVLWSSNLMLQKGRATLLSRGVEIVVLFFPVLRQEPVVSPCNETFRLALQTSPYFPALSALLPTHGSLSVFFSVLLAYALAVQDCMVYA